MSLHNLVEERATQIQAVHSKNIEKRFINYVQNCILPFQNNFKIKNTRFVKKKLFVEFFFIFIFLFSGFRRNFDEKRYIFICR